MRLPLSFVLLLSGCRLSCSADASRLGSGGELFAGLESPYVLNTSDGRTMLGIKIHPQDAARRSPVALALVIDNSGSMAGEKIEFARSASRAIVDALSEDDQVSLTKFSGSAQNLVPLMRVDSRVRAQLRAAIDQLEPESGTAILDGMQTGLRTLATAQAASRRLILLSDGQANVGPTTPEGILAALTLPSPPATLSTIGVGTDYDENVMTAIAQKGSGGFHHLNDPVQLAHILEDELKQAHAVAGTNAVVEIACPPGVRILGADGTPLERRDGKVRVFVGDLYFGAQRTLVLPIQVPVNGAAGLSVRLSYQPTDHRGERVSEVEVRYQLTASAIEVARGAVPELVVAADRTRVGHVLGDAALLLKEGDLIEAQTLLRDERKRLEARADKLTGPARAEAISLVALLRDPYVDAAPAVAAAATPDRFAALMRTAQQGQPLAEADLAQLDRGQLRLLRNVPFARHGYPFKSADLAQHFAKLSWYHANPRFDNADLDRVDADNIALAHSYEGRASLFQTATKAGSSDEVEALLRHAQKGDAVSSADLQRLDLAQLRLVRNTSYARHGYPFRASDLQSRFAAQSWYRADPAYQDSRLTQTDRDNIAAAKERERTLLAGAGGDALRDFELRSRARAWDALH